ncbi:MAG: winged helix-turn-helix domain-containing protein [Prevotella sp.]|nr:winged helix-turn-helix domain-containing protein [Prevotella sp.]
MTENRIKLLKLICNDPYISKTDLSKSLNISITSVSNNIKILRENKYIRRVGPDKGGFWEIII